MIPRPVMRDDARKRLRAALMSEAVVLAEERRARRAASPWRTLFALRPLAVAAALILVLAIAGGGAAAASSVSGDPAFAIKRVAEQLELTLAFTPEAKVKVLADQAQRRLDELTATAGRSDKAPTASVEYEKAVERFAQAVEAVRAAEPAERREAVEQLVEAARDKHVQVLEDLRERGVPAGAKEGIDRAIEDHDKLAAPGREGKKPVTPRATTAPRAGETPRGGRPTPTR
jgi:uncharacterized protein DUF5667